MSLKVERIMVQISGSSLAIQRLRKRRISLPMPNQTARKSQIVRSVMVAILIVTLALFFVIGSTYIVVVSGSR